MAKRTSLWAGNAGGERELKGNNGNEKGHCQTTGPRKKKIEHHDNFLKEGEELADVPDA